MVIDNIQSKKINKVAKRFGIKLIIAFGSQVMEKVHPHSDLDIAVGLKKGDFSFKKYSDISFALGKIFPRQKIDLVFLQRADPLLLKKISESSFLLYGKKRDLANFKIHAFNRYQDYQPYFRLEEKSVERLIKELAYAH